MAYTLVIELRGAPAGAVAVEWADAAAPEAGGTGWSPCLRLGNDLWRLASHEPDGREHLRGPGRFENVAIRYRLQPHGPWSLISEDRKAAEIVPVAADAAPAPAGAADWTAPAARSFGAAGTAAGFLGLGSVSAAAAVEWSAAAAPAAADWQPCLAFAGGLWMLAGPLASAATLNPAEVAIRYRLAPDGAWSPASADRKRLAALLPMAPTLLATPGLSGSGKIGEALAVTPGVWSGVPTPALSYRWRRDGIDIPGATAATYVPVPADDGRMIGCVETASNLLGSREAAAAAARITYLAPRAVGVIEDEVLDLEPGFVTVAAAGAFAGDNRRYSVQGARATVDADTGLVSIPTDVAVSGETVTVTATNSGGAASVSFLVTVEDEDAEPQPFALAAADMVVTARVWRPEGQETWFTPVLSFPGLVGEPVDAIEWTTAGKGVDAVVGDTQFEIVKLLSAAGGPGGLPRYQLFMRDPAKNNPLASPRVDFSVWKAGEPRQDWLRFRWRRTPTGPWSLLSAAVRVEAPPLTQTELWRPLVRRHPSHIGVTPDYPQFFDKGLYGGEGGQFFQGGARGVSDPNLIVLNQDVAIPRQSRDGGATWIFPPNRGNEMMGGTSVAIDPANADVILTLGNGAAYGNAKAEIAAREGIWRSADRGLSWTLVRAVDVERQARWFNDTFACWPLTGGSVATRKWRVLIPGNDNVLRLFRSTGGVSWTEVALPAGMANNRAYAMVQDPHAENTLWACTSSGLWRSTDNGDTWSRPFATFTFAHAGAVSTNYGDGISNVWIDPADANRMIVGRRGALGAARGLFFKTAAGDSWTKALDLRIGHFALGALSGGNRRIYVHHFRGADNNLRIATWTGAGFGSWAAPTVPSYFPGDTSGHFSQLSGREQCCALPHPTDPLECVFHGNAFNWKTADGGVTIVPASTGFGGLSARRLRSINGTDVVMAISDLQGMTSNDGGLSMVTHTISTAQKEEIASLVQYAANLYSGADIIILPDSAAIPAAKRGRLIMSAGTSREHAIFIKNRTGTNPSVWAPAWTSIMDRAVTAGGGLDGRYNVDYSRQNPNRIYCGANRSNDAGDTWSAIAGNRRMVGMSYQNGDVIYVQDGQKGIAKSLDGGVSILAANYLQTGYNITNTLSNALFWLSPHNDKLALIPAQNGDVARVLGDPGSSTVVALGLRALFDPVPPAFAISDCCFDTVNPQVFYVLLDISGRSHIWKGTFTADFGSASFLDITKNAPRTGYTASMNTFETGEVALGSAIGCWLYPAHTAGAANLCWNRLARPFENFWQVV